VRVDVRAVIGEGSETIFYAFVGLLTVLLVRFDSLCQRVLLSWSRVPLYILHFCVF
jgi:hypothetical protein